MKARRHGTTAVSWELAGPGVADSKLHSCSQSDLVTLYLPAVGHWRSTLFLRRCIIPHHPPMPACCSTGCLIRRCSAIPSPFPAFTPHHWFSVRPSTAMTSLHPKPPIIIPTNKPPSLQRRYHHRPSDPAAQATANLTQTLYPVQWLSTTCLRFFYCCHPCLRTCNPHVVTHCRYCWDHSFWGCTGCDRLKR